MKFFLNINWLNLTLLTFFLFVCGCNSKWTEEEKNGFNVIYNEDGQTLTYTPNSGVVIIENKGYAFKDLNKNGSLNIYEDWRLDVVERAKDLASQMTIEQISGLMLTGLYQSLTSTETNEAEQLEDGQTAIQLTEEQINIFVENNVRSITISDIESPFIAAKWNNDVQNLVEGIDFGIPVNICSDPRHRTISNAEFNSGAGGSISMWPPALGLAATFDPALVRNFGDIASKEYRALGITTALSPQIDLATDPRWFRFDGTFGEDPNLASDLARAYADGFQTSDGENEIKNGWGLTSVNAMAKHWPGGGSGEGGRDAHYAYGKYAVYPGNNFDEHLIPFTEGAFKLDGPTKKVSAIMPYYTISNNIDSVYGENVGNSFSTFIITDLLRDKYNYDGVVCTDFGIVRNNVGIDAFGAANWGTEQLSIPERHYKIIMAGVDQFGGVSDVSPVIDAYRIGVNEHGEDFMRRRYEQSAIRLLTNIFRLGLFENPYLEPEKTQEIVGNPDFVSAGYDAQLKSIVMLKNSNHLLPIKENATVYIPKKYFPAKEIRFGFGGVTEAKWDYPFNLDVLKNFAKFTTNPEEADYAIVLIDSPDGGNGFNANDVEAGGNGYLPISLQYKEYTADYAREESIAGGDFWENFSNRSYKGKKSIASNSPDLSIVLETKKLMGNRPVIVVINVKNPMVFSEFENNANAIIVNFGVQAQAIMDIIFGKIEPTGLLPMQMPASMRTVEEQNEDVPRDMKCYVDSNSNTYDFAFGLNWNGEINDERVQQYK